MHFSPEDLCGSVTPTTRRCDQNIQADVSEQLRDISGIDTHIGVAVNGGVVTLSGEVDSLPNGSPRSGRPS